PRQTHPDEGPAPAVALRNDTAKPDAEHAAQRHADRVDPYSKRPTSPLVVLRNDRLRCRRVARLTEADERPAGEQLPELPCDATRCGCRTPDRDAPRDHEPTRAQIADDAERQRRQREHDDVRGPKPAELRIGKTQIALDRLEDRVDDVAVEIVEKIDESQQTQDVNGIRPGRRSRLLDLRSLGRQLPPQRARRDPLLPRDTNQSARASSLRAAHTGASTCGACGVPTRTPPESERRRWCRDMPRPSPAACPDRPSPSSPLPPALR